MSQRSLLGIDVTFWFSVLTVDLEQLTSVVSDFFEALLFLVLSSYFLILFVDQ